jgi:hypothetical protein
MNLFALVALMIGWACLCAGTPGCAHHCGLEDDQRSVTTDEIDAGGGLHFESSRVEILQSIAGRRHLTPIEQQHLVCVTMNRLQFDDSREQVLNTLIDNPDFSQYAKSEILQNVSKLKFDSVRTQVMKRMENRPARHGGDDE